MTDIIFISCIVFFAAFIIGFLEVQSNKIYNSIKDGDTIYYYNDEEQSEDYSIYVYVPSTVRIKDDGKKYYYNQFLDKDICITRYDIQSGKILLENDYCYRHPV